MSAVPFPESLKHPGYETLLSEAKSRLISKIQKDIDHSFQPDLSESDPMLKFLEVLIYREFLVRQQVCDAIKASFVTTATGGDLACLANILLDESIDELSTQAHTNPELVRSKIQAFWADEFHNTGTESAYIHHAKQYDPLNILDVSVYATWESTSNPIIYIYLLIRDPLGGNGKNLGRYIDPVTSYLYGDHLHRIGEQVIVRGCNLLQFRIEATLTYDPGVNIEQIQQAIKVHLNNYFDKHQMIGYTIRADKLYTYFYQPGVQTVSIKIIQEQIWSTDGSGAKVHYWADPIKPENAEVKELTCGQALAPFFSEAVFK